jgi:hypothetical protein
MILTTRRFANRRPECSLQEVESEILAAIKIRGIVKQIQRLRELRELREVVCAYPQELFASKGARQTDSVWRRMTIIG